MRPIVRTSGGLMSLGCFGVGDVRCCDCHAAARSAPCAADARRGRWTRLARGGIVAPHPRLATLDPPALDNPIATTADHELVVEGPLPAEEALLRGELGEP